MKYTTQIIIEAPIETIVKKLDNQDNMQHWQRGLISFEHISGEPRKIGAKMKLNYKFGNRIMVLIETVTHNSLPNAFHVNYDTKGIHSIQKNDFKSTPEGYTQWICEREFFPTSFFMRMMIALMPKSFKKQSKTYLTDFKNFAEKGISVKDA